MLQAQTCGQCGRFSRPPGQKLVEHGFGRCGQLPPWQWRPESGKCAFTPSRFEAKA